MQGTIRLRGGEIHLENVREVLGTVLGREGQHCPLRNAQ